MLFFPLGFFFDFLRISWSALFRSQALPFSILFISQCSRIRPWCNAIPFFFVKWGGNANVLVGVCLAFGLQNFVGPWFELRLHLHLRFAESSVTWRTERMRKRCWRRPFAILYCVDYRFRSTTASMIKFIHSNTAGTVKLLVTCVRILWKSLFFIYICVIL